MFRLICSRPGSLREEEDAREEREWRCGRGKGREGKRVRIGKGGHRLRRRPSADPDGGRIGERVGMGGVVVVMGRQISEGEGRRESDGVGGWGEERVKVLEGEGKFVIKSLKVAKEPTKACPSQLTANCLKRDTKKLKGGSFQKAHFIGGFFTKYP